MLRKVGAVALVYLLAIGDPARARETFANEASGVRLSTHFRMAQDEGDEDAGTPPLAAPQPTPEPAPSDISQEQSSPHFPALPALDPATKQLLEQQPGIELKALLPTLFPKGVPKTSPFTGSPLPEGTLDGRAQVPRAELRALPFSATGSILAHFSPNDVGQFGTGFLIAPGVVLTAAHVIYSPTSGPALSATFSPGCHIEEAGPNLDPRYSQTVDRSGMRVSSEWSIDNTSIEWDYGVLLLPDPAMFKDCGELAIAVQDDDFYDKHALERSTDFFVVGYPFDKAYQSQWLGRSALRNAGRVSIRHLIDTMPGQSGGPLFVVAKNATTGQNVPLVIGIHSRPAPGENFNEARRIDDRVRAEIKSWIAEQAQ